MKKDRDLLNQYHSKQCIVCSRFGCDPCHIKTVGAGGHNDWWNLFPACRIHHIESHKIGIITFAEKYSQVLNYLKSMGWEIVEVFGKKKLIHSKGDE